jgi:hypothetical protein
MCPPWWFFRACGAMNIEKLKKEIAVRLRRIWIFADV